MNAVHHLNAAKANALVLGYSQDILKQLFIDSAPRLLQQPLLEDSESPSAEG